MSCINHKDREEKYLCNNCGAALCEQCTIEAGEQKLCPSCYHLAAKGAIKDLKGSIGLFILYAFVSTALYVWGVFEMRKADFWGYALGLILIALPCITSVFGEKFALFNFQNLGCLVQIIVMFLCIVTTPIMIIRSIVLIIMNSVKISRIKREIEYLKELYPNV